MCRLTVFLLLTMKRAQDVGYSKQEHGQNKKEEEKEKSPAQVRLGSSRKRPEGRSRYKTLPLIIVATRPVTAPILRKKRPKRFEIFGAPSSPSDNKRGVD